MLRPYICAACEKVIIDKDDVASLISVFSKITVTVPSEADIPKNAVAPKEWAVFSLWDTDLGDELKEYALCMQVLYPDQTQFSEVTKIKMKIEPNKRSQVVVRMLGFPIGQVGRYTINTWIEENQQRVFGPIEFKIGFEIVKQEQTHKTI
ncbi:MAG TPA: hypothetical protein VMX16_06505 [Terriglobia bacterium]|nr:hypothetical protein [Terriglobia bacterium]